MPGKRAARKRKVTIDTLFELKLIGSPAMSPDGSRCVVAIQRCDREKNTYFTDLHMMDLDSGALRQLTFGEHSDSSPRWSPDGQALAFISDRSERPQVHIMPMCGGDSRKLTDLASGGIGDLKWSPDGKALSVIYQPAPEEDTKKAQEERQTKNLSSPVREIDSAIYRTDGVGYLGTERPQLFRIDAETGEARKLTRGKMVVIEAAWSPDGKRLAYAACRRPEDRRYDYRIYIIPASGGKARELKTPMGPKGAPAWRCDAGPGSDVRALDAERCVRRRLSRRACLLAGRHGRRRLGSDERRDAPGARGSVERRETDARRWPCECLCHNAAGER